MEKAFRVTKKVESKIIAIGQSTTHNYKDESVDAPSFPQLTRLTPQKLEEKEKNDFVIVVITNMLKAISFLRRNYFT